MPEITIQYSNQKRKDMNYTSSMTDMLLAVSVGCNLWFLFLLLYERIMDTRIVRFFTELIPKNQLLQVFRILKLGYLMRMFIIIHSHIKYMFKK